MAILRHNLRGVVLRGASVAAFLQGPANPRVLASDASATVASREFEVKAAALYNIILFTEWPAAAFATPESPLVIGVLGHGPVADLLGSFIADEPWHGRRVVLQHFASVQQMKPCHVLYLGRSEHARWTSLRPQLAGKPVLTVGDADNFARQGGVVQLAIERNRLKLIVNLAAARAGDITISSKVLRLAEIVGEPTP